MKNLIAFPPNYKEILAAFPSIAGAPVIFAYGDILYNPTGAEISLDLYAHEETHERQQKAYRGGVVQWWKEYISNPDFRLEQEVEAYRNQYKFILVDSAHQRSRQVRKSMLHKFCTDLSSAMYGKLITYELAHKLITQI